MVQPYDSPNAPPNGTPHFQGASIGYRTAASCGIHQGHSGWTPNWEGEPGEPPGEPWPASLALIFSGPWH